MDHHSAAAPAPVEPRSAGVLAEIQRYEQRQLPVIWSDQPGPFVAGIVFRVGRADERTTHNGITHLVEHLALPRQAAPSVEFNGLVSGSITSFYASGEQEETLALLRDAAAAITDLPDRLATERRILLTEEEGRGSGLPAVAAAARFGPAGHGLGAYHEFGLRWLERDAASAWARERFNRSNAAVWMTGEPPAGFDLPLPEGARHPAPSLRTVPVACFPAVYPYVGPGAVGLAVLMRRSTEAAVAASIAIERARERIRYDEGLSYMVDMTWEPLTADTAHVVFLCDCQQGRERTTALLLRDVLEELAATGPTEAELAREVEARFARYSSSTGVPNLLFAQAADELLGRERTSPADLIAEADACTTEGVRAAIGEAMESALLLVGDGSWPANERWSLYPQYSSSALGGQRFRPAGSRRQRWANRKVRLEASPDGLTLVTETGDFVTVPFAECVAAERWPGGGRVLYAADASRIAVDPGAWRDGDRLAKLVDEHLPTDTVVSMNPEVETWADEMAAELPSLTRNLQAVAGHLEFGEVPLTAIGASIGIDYGALVLTPRRLVFALAGAPRIGVPLYEIETIRPRNDSWPGNPELTIVCTEATFTFEKLTRSEAATFFDALVRAVESENALVTVHPQPGRRGALARAYSLAALWLGVFAALPITALQDTGSHFRLILVSTLITLVSGGICATGIWLGFVGRRDAPRSNVAIWGIALSAFGLLFSLILASLSLVDNW